MNFPKLPLTLCISAVLLGGKSTAAEADQKSSSTPAEPRFSVSYMDPSVDPAKDFYHYAAGNWVRNNPVPADKSRWASFSELAERNWYLIHEILDHANKSHNAVQREVGDFYVSAMDTNRIEQLAFKPLQGDLQRIDALRNTDDLFKMIARFHDEGIGALFNIDFDADAKNSSIYAGYLNQGGLSLPDRDYYLKDSFTETRQKYREHVQRMFELLGEKSEDAARHASTVLALETELAQASRTRVELRDPDKNYNKFDTSKLLSANREIPWAIYLSESGFAVNGADGIQLPYEIVGQPEFFQAVEKILKKRPLDDWKTYLRWHLLHASAAYLHHPVEEENFQFFAKVLTGQQEQEPRWKRSAKVIDRHIGEALGQLYVEKYFPPEAKARMEELVENLKVVFREHLEHLDWMSEGTRAKALAKFSRFSRKIGYPEKFRDYSSIKLVRDDYLGNVRRANAFEVRRQKVRVGKPVDKTEWLMTPETVNAYFHPLKNEIVFPAGILQPPFFDVSMDDAVNYGAIGTVIGHEITHGYDDEGRKYDADGNLNTWWTESDSKEFDERADKVVKEYDAFEPLPGLHVNGKLTLGENIADLGGVTIAYEAFQRALAKNPEKRKKIDGFTPEQRFFLSFSQIWRTNIRDAEQRRLITVDPHSPGQFRAIGPIQNLQVFYDAFGIKPGDPMFRAVDERAKIW